MHAILAIMEVSLKDFARTGLFGAVEWGMNRAAVEQLLGSPDSWMDSTPGYKTSPIWKYGDIEFHFQDNALYMIFMDEFSNLNGGCNIGLDAWVINGDLTCIEAEHFLSAANIEYQKEDFPYNENGVRLITSAGTVFAFAGEKSSHITLHSLYRQI